MYVNDMYVNDMYVNDMYVNDMYVNEYVPSHVIDPFDFNESIFIGIISTVFFVFLYCAVQKIQKEQHIKNKEYTARVVSLIHAVISTIGSAYALYSHEGMSFYAPIATRVQSNWQMFTFAYFTVDTIVMFVTNTFDFKYFVHHIISMSSLACGAFYGMYGVLVTSAQLVGEISNPFMHSRWILNSHGYRESKLCKIITKIWFCIFFASRVLICPLLGYHAIMIMHWIFWPLVWIMIVFSSLFLYEVYEMEKRNEWWVG
jgi:TLC domain